MDLDRDRQRAWNAARSTDKNLIKLPFARLQTSEAAATRNEPAKLSKIVRPTDS